VPTLISVSDQDGARESVKLRHKWQVHVT